MLTIREAQMRVLHDVAVCRWISHDLTASYPERAGRGARGALDSFVSEQAKDARGRGFRRGEEVRKYVHVAFVLGAGFATDPEFAWARRILDNPDFHHPASRLRALEDAVLRHLKKTAPAAPREN